ncbi:MAG TPA: hypothetical protein VH722_06345 [Alphaproteobacteria bacterium]|jgi:hypothetical protein|nr:hypothetical protein [Alphaproteobacteria bacterium]
MITTLLILHGLLAVALLGAITHQALSTARRRSAARSFVGRFRSVGAADYTNAIVILFIVTSLFGALLYPPYRLDVRPTLEDLDMRAANGVFEIKEHLAAIGLGLLPAYWFFWRTPLTPEGMVARRYLTWILAFVIWWNFLVGHVLNNIRGLFQ